MYKTAVPALPSLRSETVFRTVLRPHLPPDRASGLSVVAAIAVAPVAIEDAGLGVSVSLTGGVPGERDRLQLDAGGAAVTVAPATSTTITMDRAALLNQIGNQEDGCPDAVSGLNVG